MAKKTTATTMTIEETNSFLDSLEAGLNAETKANTTEQWATGVVVECKSDIIHSKNGDLPIKRIVARLKDGIGTVIEFDLFNRSYAYKTIYEGAPVSFTGLRYEQNDNGYWNWEFSSCTVIDPAFVTQKSAQTTKPPITR